MERVKTIWNPKSCLAWTGSIIDQRSFSRFPGIIVQGTGVKVLFLHFRNLVNRPSLSKALLSIEILPILHMGRRRLQKLRNPVIAPHFTLTLKHSFEWRNLSILRQGCQPRSARHSKFLQEIMAKRRRRHALPSGRGLPCKFPWK